MEWLELTDVEDIVKTGSRGKLQATGHLRACTMVQIVAVYNNSPCHL